MTSTKIATMAKKEVTKDAAEVAALKKKLAASQAKLKKSRQCYKLIQSMKAPAKRAPAAAAKKRKRAPAAKKKKPAAGANKRAKTTTARSKPWSLDDMVRLTQSSLTITNTMSEKDFYDVLHKRFGKGRTRTAVVRKAKAMKIKPSPS